MSYNGSGVYTLPGAALANGDIVSATENNQFRNDVAAALNVAWTRDGQAPATANIPMGNHKLTGLAAGTGVGDSVRYEQLPSATNKLDLTTSVTGALPVANGGSGAATLTGVLKGNGTSAFTAAVAGTDYLAPAAIGTTVQGYAAELQGATQGGINGMKNRIINGAMMIDQRNAGASVTLSGGSYITDRFKVYKTNASATVTSQRSTTAPTGFANSLLYSVTTGAATGAGDYSQIYQAIEGFNVADLAWGTASAATVTLSFWVRSSVTGTYGVCFNNSAANRCYVASYAINSANTWEQKTITVAGDTSGTWTTDNSAGITVDWDMGVGTTYSGSATGSWQAANYQGLTGGVKLTVTTGATFYITGVQLEKGSTATSFDYRPYGTELYLCMRYCIKFAAGVAYQRYCGGLNYSTTKHSGTFFLPVEMRIVPSLTTTGTASNYALNHAADTVTALSSVPTLASGGSSTKTINTDCAVASGLTAGGYGDLISNNNTSSYLLFSSEL